MPCSGFMSDAELSRMNESLERTFDTVIVVLRDQGQRAPDGGEIEDFQPVGPPVKGAIWQQRVRFALTAEAMPSVSDWSAMLPISVEARAGDRLQAGAITLLVSGTDAGASDGIGQVLTCKRVG